MKRIKIFLGLLILVVGWNTELLANSQEKDSLVNLFSNDEPLLIDVFADYVSLLSDISNKRTYHQAKFSIKNTDCSSEDIPVKLKTRGNFRLRKETCDFPPLRFKFESNQSLGTVFEGQNKLKYVSHCQNFKAGYEQHTLEEYLIYKMYHLFSNYSYQVRLAQVNFIDVNGLDSIRRYGFFIEDKKHLADRIGRDILKFRNIKQYQILRSNVIVLSLFQFMIGNTDWDISRLHNIDLMAVNDHSMPVAIPYDFDWSAIIDHDYFVLDPQIDLSSKYKRRYKSYRWTDEELSAALIIFKELKSELNSLILNFEYLNKENRFKFLAYVNEFYDLISSKDDVKSFLIKNSKRIPTDY